MNRKKRKRLRQKQIDKFLNHKKIESNMGLMASGMCYIKTTDNEADNAFNKLSSGQKSLINALGIYGDKSFRDIIKGRKNKKIKRK